VKVARPAPAETLRGISKRGKLIVETVGVVSLVVGVSLEWSVPIGLVTFGSIVLGLSLLSLLRQLLDDFLASRE
jgi:hypothetical protein